MSTPFPTDIRSQPQPYRLDHLRSKSGLPAQMLSSAEDGYVGSSYGGMITLARVEPIPLRSTSRAFWSRSPRIHGYRSRISGSWGRPWPGLVGWWRSIHFSVMTPANRLWQKSHRAASAPARPGLFRRLFVGKPRRFPNRLRFSRLDSTKNSLLSPARDFRHSLLRKTQQIGDILRRRCSEEH